MRYLKIEIRRNELSSFAEVIPAYELPIVQNIHGEESVQVHGEVDFPENPWPVDAAAEHARLEQRYGKIENTDTPQVVAIYGVGMAGYRKLALAIQQAFNEAKANPIDLAAEAAKLAEAAKPKVAIDYDPQAGDTMLTDEQLDALDPVQKTGKGGKKGKAAKAAPEVLAGGPPPVDLAS
jgi:hypothetical protein